MPAAQQPVAQRRAEGRAVEHEELERMARRALQVQVQRLERELSEAFVTAFAIGGLELPRRHPSQARMLDLEALEQVRDDLAATLRQAREVIAERAERQAAKRALLERMLLEPAKHPFARVSLAEIGQPGCGVWQVRPRFGLIGMLAGWWQVRLSSGCPLAWGRGARTPRPTSADPL